MIDNVFNSEKVNNEDYGTKYSRVQNYQFCSVLREPNN